MADQGCDKGDHYPPRSAHPKLPQLAIKSIMNLGPGFIELIYLTALKFALRKIELNYEEEKEFSVLFQG